MEFSGKEFRLLFFFIYLWVIPGYSQKTTIIQFFSDDNIRYSNSNYRLKIIDGRADTKNIEAILTSPTNYRILNLEPALARSIEQIIIQPRAEQFKPALYLKIIKLSIEEYWSKNVLSRGEILVDVILRDSSGYYLVDNISKIFNRNNYSTKPRVRKDLIKLMENVIGELKPSYDSHNKLKIPEEDIMQKYLGV